MGNRLKISLVTLFAGLLIGLGAWSFLRRLTESVPRLVIAERHDLGELPYGQRKRISIEFRNAGSEVLEIKKVVAGCSCMVADLAKREYQPGESGRLEFDFLSARFPGSEFNHAAVVYTNDPRVPIHRLVFYGRMIPALSTSPAALHVRNVPVGGQWTRELSVMGLGADMEFEIEAVSSDIEGLVFTTTRLEGAGKLETGQPVPRKYKVVVRQPSVEQIGEVSGHIWIDTTNQRFQRLTVPVTVEVPSAFNIWPRFLFFRRAVDAQSTGLTSQTLTIKGPRPVELTLRSTDVPIECRSKTVGPAEEWEFTCSSRPGVNGTLTGSLEFDVAGYPPESLIEVPFGIVID